VAAITEKVAYSWYSSADNLNPAAGQTTPIDPNNKTSAYSWLKAPRYNGAAYEAGALARMRVSGYYDGGVSVMDRHVARAYETLELAEAMVGWIQELRNRLGQSNYTPCQVPSGTRVAVGLTEAPRGALGHWLEISGGKITKYQVVTPTCWNASPRGAGDTDLGPIEKALIGTPVQNLSMPIEVLRVIHSFDPCLSCAVHVMRPDEGKKIFAVPHFHGSEEIHTHGHGHLDHDHAHGHDHDH
jgi:hydrogenase large subunit